MVGWKEINIKQEELNCSSSWKTQMHKQLQIIVVGTHASGKTTMSSLIALALKELGFDVELEPDQDGLILSIEDMQERIASYREANPKIIVSQQTLKRSAKSKNGEN